MQTTTRGRLDGLRWMITGFFPAGSRARHTAADWLADDPVFRDRNQSATPQRTRPVLRTA